LPVERVITKDQPCGYNRQAYLIVTTRRDRKAR